MAGDISVYFYLYIIRQKEQRSCDGWVVGGGGGGIVLFRAPNSLEGCYGWGDGGLLYLYYIKASVQHSSEARCLSRGCSVALTAQRSSERCSVAQKGLALLRECSVALRMQHSSDRVQCSSDECSIA
jgi:hypothetical protein